MGQDKHSLINEKNGEKTPSNGEAGPDKDSVF